MEVEPFNEEVCVMSVEPVRSEADYLPSIMTQALNRRDEYYGEKVEQATPSTSPPKEESREFLDRCMFILDFEMTSLRHLERAAEKLLSDYSGQKNFEESVLVMGQILAHWGCLHLVQAALDNDRRHMVLSGDSTWRSVCALEALLCHCQERYGI